MITKERKKELIEEFKISDNDTGSSEIQVAVLTEKIKSLNEHLKIHKKDYHSRRGLLKMVGQRRAHLRYLKDNRYDSYKDVIKRLGLRK